MIKYETGPDPVSRRGYAEKRSFQATPEPQPEVAGDVDPGTARPGKSFVIHQHHARRLHFDLRLEMFNGSVPVLVSWAVPKNLPAEPKQKVLAVHVEDHPYEYGSFTGTIPAGNYGAGEVRIFDSGDYELLEQAPGKLTFRLKGTRMQGVYHLIQTRGGQKDQWLAFLRSWEGPAPQPLPRPEFMLAGKASKPFDSEEWACEPRWSGLRAFAFCDRQTVLMSSGHQDVVGRFPVLAKIHERLVALTAVMDGAIVGVHETSPPVFMAFDLIYLDGISTADRPYSERRQLLEESLVPSAYVDLTPSIPSAGRAMFEASTGQGLSGIVAKKRSSKYRSGNSSDWLEVLQSNKSPGRPHER